MSDQYESELNEWISTERKALELLDLSSKLQLDKSVELVLFRRKLFDKKISEIINDHAYAKKFTGINITIDLTLGLTKAIAALDLAPSRMDLGRLAKEYIEAGNAGSYDTFVVEKLKDFIGKEKKVLKS